MPSPHSGPQRGLPGSLHGIATVTAIVGAVFLAPHLWPAIEGWVRAWLTDAYGREIAVWLHLGCQVAMWVFVYLAIRLGLMAVFTVAVVLIVKRMM